MSRQRENGGGRQERLNNRRLRIANHGVSQLFITSNGRFFFLLFFFPMAGLAV